MSDVICPIEHAVDSDRFGGKAVGLQWLLQQGVKTAPGIVISTEALNNHLGNHELLKAITDLVSSSEEPNFESLAELCEQIQTLIQERPLSRTLLNDIKAALAVASNNNDHATWVVRSSAVSEDGAQHSFAGQFESVLNVNATDHELESAICRVWASAYQVGAWQYGLRRGVQSSQMAVIVQKQVDATFSGVLFTCDPASTGCNAMRVEYCEGLSDALVSGLINPASKTLSRNSNPNTAKAETSTANTTSLDQQLCAIQDELSNTALKIEAKAGKPLDIEWCVNSQQELLLVQCRPITVSSKSHVEHWTNANIGENFPGPVVPLLASFVPRGYAAYFRNLGITIGVHTERIEAAEESLQRLVGLQAGRLYYNLSQIVTVLHTIPGGAWLADGFNTFTGTSGSPTPNNKLWSKLSQIRQALIVLWRLPFIARNITPGVAEFEKVVDDYAHRSNPKGLASLKAKELSQLLGEFLEIRLNRWTPASLADAAAMVSYSLLKQILGKWLPDTNQTQLQNALLQGLPTIITTAPVEALWALAIKVRNNEPLFLFMQSHTATEIVEQLPKEAPEFYQEFEHYLNTWGFRYSGELMLTQETPAENPIPIIKLLKTYLADDGNGPKERSAQSAEARLIATREIEFQLTPSAWLRAIPLFSRARIFRLVLKATQASICLRERARMKQALLYTRLRHVCLALGDHLVEQELIADRDSVFFLSIEEAIALPATDETQQPQHALINKRRAEFERCEQLQPPEQMQLPIGVHWTPVPTETQSDDNNGSAMIGLGACTGTVTGQASVVLDVSDIDTVEKDTVLVTRQTDPGWAPVFFLIKGLVVERGGMLSHGAIIAREYGIPAVVGIENATTRISSGDWLKVDGNQGCVTWVD